MGLSRLWRRHRALDEPFPDAWRALLTERMAHWRLLDDDERARLEQLVQVFIVDKRWEAARGFEVTEDMRVVISALACLLVLELDYDCYSTVDWILVHPTTFDQRGVHDVGVPGVVSDEPEALLGQAQYDGPVLIAWDVAAREARHPETGHNVVYHEFAHKLDMTDRVIDGTPYMADPAERDRWITVCTREFEAVRDRRSGPLLDPYAGVNPAEFFAVVTEVFFDRPVDLERDHGELYEVLAAYYRQDPAARLRRARSG